MNSRTKGAVGEREVASMLRGYGYKARRGQQYSGANGDADVGWPSWYPHRSQKKRETQHIRCHRSGQKGQKARRASGSVPPEESL